MQRESQNTNAFDNVYTFQDLDFPDAQRIRGLEQLLGGFTVLKHLCNRCLLVPTAHFLYMDACSTCKPRPVH